MDLEKVDLHSGVIEEIEWGHLMLQRWRKNPGSLGASKGTCLVPRGA